MYTHSVHLCKLLSICSLSGPGSLGRNTVDPKALLKAKWVLRLYRLRRATLGILLLRQHLLRVLVRHSRGLKALRGASLFARVALGEGGHSAEALGLSWRQVAYYASGEHEVPRTVLLACKGWEAEQRAAA